MPYFFVIFFLPMATRTRWHRRVRVSSPGVGRPDAQIVLHRATLVGITQQGWENPVANQADSYAAGDHGFDGVLPAGLAEQTPIRNRQMDAHMSDGCVQQERVEGLQTLSYTNKPPHCAEQIVHSFRDKMPCNVVGERYHFQLGKATHKIRRGRHV